jgi:hypothetical protein
MFILFALHEATSAAVSTVYHDRNIKSYEFSNALSLKIFNRKLHKVMKNNNVRILLIDHKTTREDFTQHELHFNAAGKIKVVTLMFQNISELFEVKKKHPIIMQWRATLDAPGLGNSIP